MRYTGLQPQYFPRLHYFARILSADLYMIRDDVQFVRKHRYPDGHIGKSYQVHTPIKSAEGLSFLTVPVKHDGRQSIADTEVMYDVDWTTDHIKTILCSYHKSANFQQIQEEIHALLQTKYRTLSELNTATILWGILRLLGEDTVMPDKLTIQYVQKKLAEQSTFRLRKIRLESETDTAKRADTRRNERIVALCKEVGANEDYCGGTATSAYVDHSVFESNSIKITVQDWKCQNYQQQFSKKGFVGNLSIIDLIMNVPQERRVQIIQNKNSSAFRNTSSLVYGLPSLEPEMTVYLSEIMGVIPIGIFTV